MVRTPLKTLKKLKKKQGQRFPENTKICTGESRQLPCRSISLSSQPRGGSCSRATGQSVRVKDTFVRWLQPEGKVKGAVLLAGRQAFICPPALDGVQHVCDQLLQAEHRRPSPVSPGIGVIEPHRPAVCCERGWMDGQTNGQTY